MRTYDVHTYDVWGNARDGYSVNDRYMRQAKIELPDEVDDKAIIRALKSAGIVRANCRISSFDIEGERDYTLYITHGPSGGYPVCELECQRDTL